MKIVADIVRRFSMRLVLVAIVALALQAGGASVYGLDPTGDCPNEVHLSRSTDRGSEAASAHQIGIGHDHEAPCTSPCCNVAYAVAVLAIPATVQAPASTPGIRYTSVFLGAEGIDLEQPSRPPRKSPSI